MTGRRRQWSGVGVNLETAHPDGAAISKAVDDVLTVPSYRERARALQAEVTAAPGAAGIEKIVGEFVAVRH